MVDFRTLCSKISLGALYPSMKIQAVDRRYMAASSEDPTLVPVDEPAILITMDVVESATQGFKTILTQTFAIPKEALASEEAAVTWIFGRCAIVLLHELQEFFRYGGEVFRPPVHPIPEA